MRITPPILLAITLLAAGCTSPGARDAEAPSDARALSSIAGVNASADGDIALVGGNGIRVEPDAENATVRLALGPVAQVRGALIACGAGCNTSAATSGMVVADGSVLSHNDLGLNVLGPDRDSTIYFYDDGRRGGQHVRWSEGADRFQVSNDIEVLGEVLVFGPVGTVSAASTSIGAYVFTAAMEGTEQSIYLRGSAMLEGGAATIAFPEEFAVVVGNGTITAQVTLTGPGPTLYVSEKTREHIVVKPATPFDGTVGFDWFVQAPRAGGESFRAIR